MRSIEEKQINAQVTADVVELIATERNEMAMLLRDKGKVEEARQVLNDNESYLIYNSKLLKSEKLKAYALEQKEDADNLDEQEWDRQRKKMQEGQFMNRSQRRSR